MGLPDRFPWFGCQGRFSAVFGLMAWLLGITIGWVLSTAAFAQSEYTVHPSFASAEPKPRAVPKWKPSYPNLSPAPLSEILGDQPLDDQAFAGLDLALTRNHEYLRKLGTSQTRAGTHPLRADLELGTLEALRAKLEAKGKLTPDDLAAFFVAFRTRPAGDLGKATGYFEPVVQARLQQTPDFMWPIYPIPTGLRRPDDTREKIVFDASLEGRAEPIAFLPTPVDVSILHIQGSALLDLGDGTVGRVNYHAANGHPYRAIGRKLLDVIPKGEMSVQSIKAYLLKHPDRWREVLSYDTSYVFLRRLSRGPIGTIQQVVTPERSIAVDPREIPLGSLCLLRIPSLGISRLVLAQDTGGAIKGPGRLDYFRGTGTEAAKKAGGMNEKAELYVLLPKLPPTDP